MKNENKNKKTVIVGIILLILALLLIVIAVTVGSSKEEHVNSESIVDSVIDSTEDNVSETDKVEEPSISDIPVAPENNEVGNDEVVDKDNADKFTDGDEHDKIGEEKDELNNNKDDELENNNDSNNNDDESEKTDDSSDNGENNSGENNNKPTVTPIPSEKDEEDNDGNDKEEDVTPVPTPSEKPVEPTQKPTPSPTPSEKPEKEEDKPSDSKDKVVWNGKEYEKSDAGYGTGGSMTLDTIGTTLPLLPEFNDFGVEDIGTGWVGDTPAEEEILHQAFEDLRDAMIDKGIAGDKDQLYGYYNYNLGFSWTMSGGQDDFELSRDPESGIYTLTICRDLKSDYTTLKNADISGYNRDIVKSLLSVIVPNVEEVYGYLYKGMYEDSSILYVNSYKTVGDCQIKLDKNVGVEDGKITYIKFYIKGN